MKMTINTMMFTMGLLCLVVAGPARAQQSQDITLTHPGTGQAFLAFARSACKAELARLNKHAAPVVDGVRTKGKPNPAFPSPDPDTGLPTVVEFLAYSIPDVENASAPRVRVCVTIILQDFIEVAAQRWDEGQASRDADLAIITPVRDRGQQTTIDSDFN